MQQSETSEELRALYIQRADRNRGTAERCLIIAGFARREGDTAKADELLEKVRILRAAARVWRRKARR